MQYLAWISGLHPTTRSIFETLMLDRYPHSSPKYIVFIESISKMGETYAEIANWLNTKCPGRWYEVGFKSNNNINILGFDDQAIAMECVLTYGKNT